MRRDIVFHSSRARCQSHKPATLSHAGDHGQGGRGLALPLHPVLASVIATIAVNKWRMTKGLGYTMFAVYAIFVAQDLARQR